MIKINVNNFRSFVNASFEFSKFNILIGENNSGKSSLIKFLLALRDTLIPPNESNLKLKSKGKFEYDLGNYKDVVYYNNEDNNIEFSFEMGDEYDKYFLEHKFTKAIEKDPRIGIDAIKDFMASIKNNSKYFTRLSFSVTKNLNLHTEIITKFENEILGGLFLEYIHDKDKDSSQDIKYPKCNLIYSSKVLDEEYIINNATYEMQGFLSLVRSEELLEKCELLGENGIKIFIHLAYMLLTQNYVESLLLKLNYINPLDSKPQRLFEKTDRKAFYRNDLASVVNFLGNLNESQRDIFLKVFNNLLSDYGIAKQIEFIVNNELSVIQVKVQIMDLISNLSDSGYGVALQIPLMFIILLKSFEEEDLIIIEQPELHLHPKLQSKFIETLVKYSGKNFFLIETHSEHIIRKLQVMIKKREHDLKKEDVTIHYLFREDKQSIISRHEIDDNGKLRPIFPGGFYDASYQLAMELLD
ncbi:MAG: ATP-binding protein [Ignavibacteria bacterium]|nr:ATP-binding protein [Ignavibacteria bacterium]